MLKTSHFAWIELNATCFSNIFAKVFQYLKLLDLTIFIRIERIYNVFSPSNSLGFSKIKKSKKNKFGKYYKIHSSCKFSKNKQ